MDTGNGTSVKAEPENTAMLSEAPGPQEIVHAIRALVGKEIVLETKDGSRRHGVLTDAPMNKTIIGYDTEYEWPRGVILAGDKTDEISWAQLAWIRLA